MSYAWGPDRYGVPLHIDPDYAIALDGELVSMDVEDNEEDGMVGIGFFDGKKAVYITSFQYPNYVEYFRRVSVVGHNFKSDLHKLRSWGINVPPENVIFDTRLASYVLDSSSQDHGLKSLAKRLLNIEYPSYEEITTIIEKREKVRKTEVVDGKRKKLVTPVVEYTEVKKRTTLDKLPVELVANYNAMDCIATWKLYERFKKNMSEHQLWYLHNIELPTMRVLYEMEKRGIKIDVSYMEGLNEEFKKKADEEKANLFRISNQEFNPNSPAQVRAALNKAGVMVGGTDKKADLSKHRGNPVVESLLRYKEVTKLQTTYTDRLLRDAANDVDQRVHTTFNQSLITGRLSSTNPNLQNIPARTEEGKKLRKGFIAEEGNVLVCADYGQIDLRAMAHFSGEPAWVEAFASNGDPHKNTAEAISKASGKEIQRQTAKTLNFTMGYGSGPSNVAYEVKCSEDDAAKLIDSFWAGLPTFREWVSRVHLEAERNGGVRTLFNRFIPIPHIKSSRSYYSKKLGRTVYPERDAAKREAVSYKGQGSPAEIIKLAMIRLAQLGYVPLLQVHDELVFEVPEKEAEKAKRVIENVMSNVVKLSVPLEVKAGIGKSWLEAKA